MRIKDNQYVGTGFKPVPTILLKGFTMKIISWNVNGIRAALRKGFVDFLKEHDPDIICIQETKAPKGPVLIDAGGYHLYWNHAEKAGYSGTLIMSKKEALSVQNGLGKKEHDQEGRVITVELKDYYLVNVYTPNTKRDLSRLPYRYKEWDVLFLKHVKALEKKKPVIFCGDLNVAHTEIDLARPKGNENTHGFTKEEREGFDNIIKTGFVDTFREFEKEGGHYSWWSQMSNCRARNIGWRIDYFLVSPALRKKLKTASILKDVMGSDHCPVQIELKK